MEIPYQSLEPATLQRLIEQYVTREGTDYGHLDHTLESKVAAVMTQLKHGSATITFDQTTETVNIVPS